MKQFQRIALAALCATASSQAAFAQSWDTELSFDSFASFRTSTDTTLDYPVFPGVY